MYTRTSDSECCGAGLLSRAGIIKIYFVLALSPLHILLLVRGETNSTQEILIVNRTASGDSVFNCSGVLLEKCEVGSTVLVEDQGDIACMNDTDFNISPGMHVIIIIAISSRQ